jgi:bacillopeptidase F
MISGKNRLKPVVKQIILFSLVACLLVFVEVSRGEAEVLSIGLRQVVRLSAAHEEIPVILSFAERVDLSRYGLKETKPRTAEMIRALKERADSSQLPLESFLRSRGARRIRRFWIFNGMALKARPEVIEELSRMSGIDSMRLDEPVPPPEVLYGPPFQPEWNIEAVRAPELWASGFNGKGIVVANMDSGVDVDHPDLTNKWRGGENSWFDPHGEHVTPQDSVAGISGHGTQTMGLMVGGCEGCSVIGVAPGAEWIAVKIWSDAGEASLSDIHAGFQWLLDPDGHPATDDFPDVVSNSWGDNSRVNQCYLEFESDIQALKAAGIAVVFAAGNRGPGSSSSLPPANNPSGFAVGSVDGTLTLDSSSSRGPSPCDGGGEIFPEVTAPGDLVRTTDLTFGGIFPDSYVYVSGTSFSAPHAAGVMALLRDVFPASTPLELEAALKQSAVDLGAAGPDNDYGHGLVDAMGALDFLIDSPGCTDGDGDGHYAQSGCYIMPDCDDGDPDIHSGAREIKRDGIDQDCDGYDLTIRVRKAVYVEDKDRLRVVAKSDLNRRAGLELKDYGPMDWKKKNKRWKLVLDGAGGDPGCVTVTGREGFRTKKVLLK